MPNKKLHPHLIPGWSAPPAPDRFPNLTVIDLLFDSGNRWQLDFSRLEEGTLYFASDVNQCPAMMWPWLEDFTPTNEDWKAIGIVAVVKIRVRASSQSEASQTEEAQRIVDQALLDMSRQNGSIH